MNTPKTVAQLRESAEFALRLGHKDMDGISAENLARELLEAVVLLEKCEADRDEALADAADAERRLYEAETAIDRARSELARLYAPAGAVS